MMIWNGLFHKNCKKNHEWMLYALFFGLKGGVLIYRISLPEYVWNSGGLNWKKNPESGKIQSGSCTIRDRTRPALRILLIASADPMPFVRVKFERSDHLGVLDKEVNGMRTFDEKGGGKNLKRWWRNMWMVPKWQQQTIAVESHWGKRYHAFNRTIIVYQSVRGQRGGRRPQKGI